LAAVQLDFIHIASQATRNNRRVFVQWWDLGLSTTQSGIEKQNFELHVNPAWRKYIVMARCPGYFVHHFIGLSSNLKFLSVSQPFFLYFSFTTIDPSP
jgi:hypothetical protein